MTETQQALGQPVEPAARSREGFLGHLFRGQLRWDLIHPFPEQAPADRGEGDAAIADLERFLSERVDPEEVERARRVPDDLAQGLRELGLLKLQLPRDAGGRQLSAINTFRVCEAAMRWSRPVGLVLGVHNGLGVGAILPAMPEGPLKRWAQERIASGALSGWADTEPAGAANRRAQTTATLTEDGRAYLLRGTKVFIGNGPIANVLNVTATVRAPGVEEEVRLFAVETSAPGFRVRTIQELMGLKGLPMAALELEDVRVPKERMLASEEAHWRLTPLLEPISALGRMYSVASASLAIARLCVEWTRDFCNRRQVDGRPLGTFDEVRRMIAASAAELFAMEAVVEWSLLGAEGPGLPLRWFEQMAAKNLTSVTSWRIADRTMSLLAAEGYETADSKARRGAPPLPLERAFRDARGMRISGGVDFHVDNRGARLGLFSCHGPKDANLGPAPVPRDVHLGERCREHLSFLRDESQRLAHTCQRLVRQHPDRAALFEKERTLIRLSQISNELFAMSVTLARASTRASRGDEIADALADVYCTEARSRIETCWREVAPEQEPALERLVRAVLSP